ncbi:MAG TPA: hypothetical protein VGC42_16300 [Kofleriaceae bacterium]
MRHARDLVLAVAGYAIARWILLAAIGGGGVLMPGHAVEPWRLGAALALLVMRLTILIAVPLVIGYRLAGYFIPWITTRLRAP